MGYDYHVTRAEQWYESPSNPISVEEWEAAAASLPGLRENGYLTWGDIGRQKRFEVDGEDATFYWRDGMVNITGRYSAPVQAVARELAVLLGARVLGDED